MRMVVALCLGACGSTTVEVTTTTTTTTTTAPADPAPAATLMRAPADTPPAELPPIGEALPCAERVPAFRAAMTEQWPEHHHRRVDLPDAKVWGTYTPGRTVVIEIDAQGTITHDGSRERWRSRLVESAQSAREEDGQKTRPLDVLADQAAPAKACTR